MRYRQMRTGRMAMLMFTRSMLQSMKARKQRATIVHLRCHLEGAATACNTAEANQW